jgi:hypothetical protein
MLRLRLRRRIDRLDGELRGLDVGLRNARIEQRRSDGGHQFRVGIGCFLDGLALGGDAAPDLRIIRRDMDAAFADDDHARFRLGRRLLRLRARRDENCRGGQGCARQKAAWRGVKREFSAAARGHDDLHPIARDSTGLLAFCL